MKCNDRGFVGLLGLVLALALAGFLMYTAFNRYTRQESLPADLQKELPGVSAAPAQAGATVDVMKKKLDDASKVLEERAAETDAMFH